MALRFLKAVWGTCLLALAVCRVVMAADEQPITLYTESFPPYNYQDEGGELKGVALDVVVKIMTASGMPYEIKLLPWARTYREAMKDKRGLIFSLARSEVREDQFEWLAYLATPEFYLFGRASENRQVSTEAIKRGDFTAICEDIDASCMILMDAGFPRSKLYNRGDGGSSETTMIEYGRADFYLGDIYHHPFRMKALGKDVARTKPIFKVGEGFALYLAAGLHVDMDIRTRIREAYSRLVETGALQAD